MDERYKVLGFINNSFTCIHIFIKSLNKGDFLDIKQQIIAKTANGTANYVTIHLDSSGGDPDEYSSLNELVEAGKCSVIVHGQCDSAAAWFVTNIAEDVNVTFSINTILVFHTTKYTLNEMTSNDIEKHLSIYKLQEDRMMSGAKKSRILSSADLKHIKSGEDIVKTSQELNILRPDLFKIA